MSDKANLKRVLRGFGLWVLVSALTGCGVQHAGHDHEHDHDHDHGSGAALGHSHGEDAQSFSGATYKEGEGITLLEETRKILGIEVREVMEKHLPNEVSFLARVFAVDAGVAKRSVLQEQKTFQALGRVPNDDAGILRRGAAVSVTNRTSGAIKGIIERIEPIPGEDAEVIMSFSAEEAQLGDFAQVKAQIHQEKPVAAVPQQAVVRGLHRSVRLCRQRRRLSAHAHRDRGGGKWAGGGKEGFACRRQRGVKRSSGTLARGAEGGERRPRLLPCTSGQKQIRSAC